MSDLAIFEGIVCLLLAVSSARPFFRAFREARGIVFLPPVVFALSLASLPAYGFRPEFVPAILLSLIAFLGGLPRLVDTLSKMRVDDASEGRWLLHGLGVLLAVGTFLFARLYAPLDPERPSADASRPLVLNFTVPDPTGVAAIPMTAWLPAETAAKPPVLMAAPVLGGRDACAALALQLARRGVPVFVFSLPSATLSLDPTVRGGDFPGVGMAFQAIRVSVTASTDAKTAARASELERRAAELIAYLTSGDGGLGARVIRALPTDRASAVALRVSGGSVGLVGMGLGGGGGVLLAASGDDSEYRFCVSLESPLYGSYVLSPEDDADGQKTLLERLASLRAVPPEGTRAPRPILVPTLFLEAESAAEPAGRDGRYATTIGALRAAPEGSYLGTIGKRLDFSGVSAAYPVYGLFAAASPPVAGAEVPARAAELIVAFGEKTAGSSASWDAAATESGLRLETAR